MLHEVHSTLGPVVLAVVAPFEGIVTGHSRTSDRVVNRICKARRSGYAEPQSANA